jgi:hypothetical protein
MNTHPTLGERIAAHLESRHIKPTGLSYAETARVIDRANLNQR